MMMKSVMGAVLALYIHHQAHQLSTVRFDVFYSVGSSISTNQLTQTSHFVCIDCQSFARSFDIVSH